MIGNYTDFFDFGFGKETFGNAGFGDLGSDPIQGLPQEPMQSPIIDPAQEAFQFPFQYPNQNPSGGEEGGQYSPVDVPENMLQQTPDPFAMWVDVNSEGNNGVDLMDKFNPNASLVANLEQIGKGLAEQQGFDLGVFGELSLNQSLLSNVWNATKSMNQNPNIAWDWAGDFPSLFEGASEAMSEMGEQIIDTAQGFAENLQQSFGFGQPELNPGMEETDIPEPETRGAKEEVGSSPVEANAEEVSTTGVDMTAAKLMNGTVPETEGNDVLPSVTDLVKLAATLLG